MSGFYYLHSETKDLIWKKFCPELDSPFVEKVWAVDTTDRGNAWQIMLEALAMNVNLNRAKYLAERWGLTFEDSMEMLKRVQPTELMKKGFKIFIQKILDMEIDEYQKKIRAKGESYDKLYIGTTI